MDVILILIVGGLIFLVAAAFEWIYKFFSTAGIYSYNTYLSYILRWSPSWLATAVIEPTDIYRYFLDDCGSALVPKERYSSFKEYERSSLPWLLLESWENIKRDYRETLERRNGIAPDSIQLVINSVNWEEDNWGKLCCQILVSDNDNATLPKEDDLLLIHNGTRQQIFGLQSVRQRIDARDRVHPSLRPQCLPKPNSPVCMELTILVPSTETDLNQNSKITVQVITSMISDLRRLRTLASLKRLPLIRQLLSPDPEQSIFALTTSRTLFTNLFTIGGNKTCMTMNETQNRIVTEATSMVCEDSEKSEKLYMIQGPPGTGKSHTIVGIIRSIAERWSVSERGKKPKMLVCAPSNGACNELARKLIANQQGLNLLRLGRDEGFVTNDEMGLQAITLESLIEQRRKNTNDQNLRMQIIEEADVIICTLNYAGNRIFDPFCPQPPDNDVEFDCLIVDEACQALEVDTFIPLRLGMRRVILVGDPEQLSPTVISMQAQNANFGRSLLERLYTLFKESDTIRMLNIQYRMAEQICQFPSQHIYRGQLLTDEATQRERATFRLKPYAFINVQDSRAQRHEATQSYFNNPEADCIDRLIRFLNLDAEVPVSSIGIIVPYKQQIENIKSRISSSLDIGTVDDFQGREKSVILLSTVGTYDTADPGSSIACITDRRQLNVALTRGQYAVYIIGHTASLSINGDWSALINDAQHRRCVFHHQSTDTNFDYLFKDNH